MDINQSTRQPLMVGPLSGSITGQMVAFREAISALEKVTTLDSSFLTPISIFRFWIQLPFAFWRSNGPIYITTSRSLKGFWLRDLPVFFSARLLKRPIVNHLHGNDFLKFRQRAGWPTTNLIDYFYSSFSIACVPAKNLALHYSIYPKTIVKFIPNFFDPLVENVTIPKCSHSPLNILYFSNFIASKGFVTAYEAVRILHERGVATHLTLCGNIIGSPEMSSSEVKLFLDRISTDSFVTVKSAVFGDEKLKVLQNAHVMLLPTRYPTEASPISLIEGLVAGCYIVTTNQGSIGELLAGYDVDIIGADPIEIANAIFNFYHRDDKDYIIRSNRDRAVIQYSSENFRKSIREVINAFKY